MSETLGVNSNLSHYRILEKLGAGGMGEVFLAEDSKLDRKVALKVLPENIARDGERMQRFVREAKSASALNHPNIITIYEIGETDSTHFIAAEYIEGETLHARLKGEPLALQMALDIAIQVTGALDAAHRAGIIHRDVKPDNVMLRPDGLVKLLDFGIAKLIEKRTDSIDAEAPTAVKVQTTPGVVIGTANYMSPEQARGKEIDARTDIFSFGIMLYEMLSGGLPFEGESAIDVIGAILHKEPVPLSQIASELPRELQHIVEKCLRKDREERYQTARDLLIDLKDVKQELEFQNKLERTGSPEREESKTQILNAAASDKPPPTSSAEYIVNRIKNHKPVAAIAFAVLLVASIGIGYWFFLNRAENARQIESIAVLPFVNASGNADVEYLSDGMTESLISSLSQVPNLSVKARSSVFRYKGQEIAPNRIGQELSVQAVLTGNVLQRGNDLALFVELVDTNTEKVLWSENYNRPLANLLALQTEIARDVSRKLQARLTGADERKLENYYTENAEAYQLYLKGRFFWYKRTVKDLEKAIEFFRQAVMIDPNYALAYTGLADSYVLLPTYGTTLPREVMPKAREAALKALSLDDQLAEAHISLGLVLNFYDYDFAGAEREFKTAIELDPSSATARLFYGNLLSTLGRHEEAIAEHKRAVELEPLMLNANRLYGLILYYAGRFDEAIAQLKKAVELDASFAPAYDSLATVYFVRGDYAESVEAFAKNQELIGEHQTALLARESFSRGGWQGFLRAMTDEPVRAKINSYRMATFFAALGEKDKAFEELGEAYENREFFMILVKVDKRLDSLRDDPRFQELLRKVGFL